MGQSINPLATHDPVPDEVKKDIPPVEYTPCPPELYQTDVEVCEDCGSAFGWFCASTNCDVCGRMLCVRCCPPRYLLHDNPACQQCTQQAYQLRRMQMLKEHYDAAGAKGPMPRQPLRGQTIRVMSKSEAAAAKASAAAKSGAPVDGAPISADQQQAQEAENTAVALQPQ